MIEGDSNIGYKLKYYCTAHEDFIELSPIAPSVCPVCFAGAKYIIGPFKVKEVDLDKELTKYYRSKKGRATRK